MGTKEKRGTSGRGIRHFCFLLLVSQLVGCAALERLQAPATPPEPTPNLLPRERLQLAIDLLDQGNAKRASVELKAYRASLNPSAQTAGTGAPNRAASAPSNTASDSSVMTGTNAPASGTASANVKPAPTPPAKTTAEKGPDAPAVVPAPPVVRTDTAVDPWAAIRENVEAKRYDAAIKVAEANHLTPDKARAPLLASAYLGNAKAVRRTNAAQSGAQALRAGRLYLETADMPEEAMDALQIAVAVSPNDNGAKTLLASAKNKTAETYYRNGMIAFRNQDLDGAIAAWDRVLAIDPNYDKAQSNRAQAVELKKALQALK